MDLTETKTNALIPVTQFNPTIDITERAQTYLPPISKEELDTRAFKYHMALGDSSPGIDKVTTELGTPDGENRLRILAADQEKQSRQQAAINAFKNEAGTTSAQDLQDMLIASQKSIGTNSVLEKRYAEDLVSRSLISSSNPQEAASGVSEFDQAMHDFAVDNITRYEGFSKLLENRRAANKQSSWASWGASFAKQLIPLYSALMMKNNATSESIKSILPGQNISEQVAYLRNLPPEEAIQKVTEIDQKLSESNPLVAEEFLSYVVDGHGAVASTIDNVGAIMDVAGLAGAARGVGAKLAKGALKVAGKGEVKLTGKTIRDIVNHIPADVETKVGAPRPAKGALGPLQKEYAAGPIGSPEYQNRVERLALAATQPGAKPENILAAAGHTTEAARVSAVKWASKAYSGASTSVKEGIADIAERVPSLSNPKSWFIESSLSHIPRATELANQLEKNSDLLAEVISGVSNVNRLNAGAEETALAAAERAMEAELKQAGLGKALLTAFERYKAETSGLNQTYIEAKLGTKSGKLFSSARVADNTMQMRGYAKGDYTIIQDGDGYAALMRRDVSEVSDTVREADFSPANVTRNKWLGIIPSPKSLHTTKDTFSAEQNAARLTATNAPNQTQAYLSRVVDPLRDMPKQEVEAIKKIMNANRNAYRVPGDASTRGEFYKTYSEFEQEFQKHVGRLPTEREAVAYQTFVQLSDMDYVIRSTAELTQKARLGAVRNTIKVGSKETTFEGIPVDSLPFNSREPLSVFVNFGQKGSYHRLNEAGLAEKLNKKIKDGELKIIHVFDPEDTALKKDLAVSGPVNFIITKDVTKSALRFNEQLPYKPGFHVKYKATHYVKQARINYDSAARRIYNGDTTIFGVENGAKAEKYAKLLEEARQGVLAKSDEAIQAAVDKGLPMSVGEVKKAFKTRLDHKVPISYVRSGQSSADSLAKTASGKALADEVGHFDDFSNSSYNLAKKVRQEYTGEKNSSLYSIEDGTEDNPLAGVSDAELFDPVQTQVEAMGRLVRQKHFRDYQLQASDNFVREFGEYLSVDGKTSIPKNELLRNPVYYVMNGKLREGGTSLDPRFASASVELNGIRNLLTQKSYLRAAQDHLTDKILDSAYTRWGEKSTPYRLAEKAVPYLKTDVSAKFRAFAFQTKMGFWNVAQVPLNLNTMAAMAAISPKHGMKAALVSWAMRKLDNIPGDTQALEHMAKHAAATAGGWTPEEFKESYRLMTRKGYDIIGNEHSWRNMLEDDKIITGKTKKFLDSSTSLFRGTERYVRIAAWNTAYKEYIEKFPKLAGKLTDRDAETILNRADDLSINMSRSSHAFWQEGEWSLATQFWGYTMRMSDLLTGKRLTVAEKTRLIASNALLYGIPVGVTPGLPFWPWKNEVRDSLLSYGIDPNSGMADVMVNGLVASAISGLHTAAYGEDLQLDIGGRWGPNSIDAFYNLYQTKRGDTGFDELVQILGGASGTLVGQMVGDLWKTVKDTGFMLGEGEVPKGVLLEDVLNTASVVSTFSSLEKIYMAYNLGVQKTKDGRVLDDNYTIQEGLVQGLTGISPQEVQDTYSYFRISANEQALENKVSKETKTWLRLYYDAYDQGDSDLAQEYMIRARGLMDSIYMPAPTRQKLMLSVRKEQSLEKQSRDTFIKSPNNLDMQRVRKKMIDLQGSNGEVSN